jgi:hypothetical protein
MDALSIDLEMVEPSMGSPTQMGRQTDVDSENVLIS